MPKVFYDRFGYKTSILRSQEFLGKSFAERKKMAFSKDSYKDLDAYNKGLLSGYATAIKQREDAERYKFKQAHPEYKSKKTKSKK